MAEQSLGTLCGRGGAEKRLPGVSWDIPGAQGAYGSRRSGPSLCASCRAVRRRGKGGRKQEGQRWGRTE